MNKKIHRKVINFCTALLYLLPFIYFAYYYLCAFGGNRITDFDSLGNFISICEYFNFAKLTLMNDFIGLFLDSSYDLTFAICNLLNYWLCISLVLFGFEVIMFFINFARNIVNSFETKGSI